MAKIALCVGINDYPGFQNDLQGCVNDAHDWAGALQSRGFDVDLLLDSGATKTAILSRLKSAIAAAKATETVVFTYSGHGTWVPDQNGDESDGRDEAIVPYDFAHGLIVDDELADLFAANHTGARIVMISDSCHSGTVARFAVGLEEPAPKIRFMSPSMFLHDLELPAARRVERAPRKTSPKGRALLMSGCLDTEYSYDATFGGRPNGAFTYFALQALRNLPDTATYGTWHTEIRKLLPSTNYPQRPGLDGTASQKKWTCL